jgi:hypothetical protein
MLIHSTHGGSSGSGGGSGRVIIAGSDASLEATLAASYVCDGTNDEVQFQAAIDAMDAEGGVLEVAGTLQFQAVADITVPWNVIIKGAGFSWGWGPNATIKRTGGTGALLNIATDTQISDIYLADEGTAGRTSPLITVDGCNLEIDHTYFNNAQPTGACILAGSLGGSIKARHCQVFMGNATSGDFVDVPDGSFNVDIDDTVYQTRGGYLVDYDDTSGSFSPDVTIRITRCQTIHSSSWLVQGLVRAIGSGSGPLRVEVKNNQVGTAQAIAIDLTGCTPLISGNTFGRQGNPTTNLGTTAVKLTSCTTGGYCNDNEILHAGHHGIWLLDSSDISVQNNDIRSVGRTTNATYSNILIDGNSDRNSVKGNKMRRASSGNQPLYGVRVDDSTCNDNEVRDNDLFQSCATNGNEVSDLGTGTRGMEMLLFALSDETTAIAATGEKLSVRWPYPFVVTKIRASLRTASASGGPFTIDIEEGGASILLTDLLEIDDTELTSVTATQPNITDRYLADDAVVTFDVDDVGDGAATGAKVAVYGYRI